jgi:hypothetical protein
LKAILVEQPDNDSRSSEDKEKIEIIELSLLKDVFLIYINIYLNKDHKPDGLQITTSVQSPTQAG